MDPLESVQTVYVLFVRCDNSVIIIFDYTSSRFFSLALSLSLLFYDLRILNKWKIETYV